MNDLLFNWSVATDQGRGGESEGSRNVTKLKFESRQRMHTHSLIRTQRVPSFNYQGQRHSEIPFHERSHPGNDPCTMAMVLERHSQ